MNNIWQQVRQLLSRIIGSAPLQRMMKNAGWLLGAQMLALVVGVVQYPLVVRLLGAEGYGLLGLVSSWAAVVGQIFSIRLREVVVKYLTEFKAEANTPAALALLRICYLLDTAMTAVFVVLVLATASLAAQYVLRAPEATGLIQLEGLRLLTLFSSGASAAVVLVYDRVRWLTAHSVFGTLGTFVLVVVALGMGWGVAGYIIASAIITAIQTLALFIKAWQLIKSEFAAHWWGQPLGVLRPRRREIAGMMFSVNVDSFRKIALEDADVLLLGWFTSPATVGVYKLAKQLANYLSRLSGPVYNLVYPEVARLYASNRTELWRFLGRLTRLMALGLLIALVGIVLLAQPLIPLVFGPEFTRAIPLFFITALSNVWLLIIWGPGLLLTMGKARQLTVLNLFTTGTMVVVLVVLIANFEASGAAIGFALQYGLWVVTMGIYLARLPDFDTRQVLAAVRP